MLTSLQLFEFTRLDSLSGKKIISILVPLIESGNFPQVLKVATYKTLEKLQVEVDQTIVDLQSILNANSMNIRRTKEIPELGLHLVYHLEKAIKVLLAVKGGKEYADKALQVVKLIRTSVASGEVPKLPLFLPKAEVKNLQPIKDVPMGGKATLSQVD